MKEKQQVYAVIRWDRDVEDVVNAITVKEIFPDEQEAFREVVRLNKLNAGKNAGVLDGCGSFCSVF